MQITIFHKTRAYLRYHSIALLIVPLISVLSSFVNKKKRSFHNSNSNGANPDWAEGFRVSGLIGGNFNNDAKQM